MPITNQREPRGSRRDATCVEATWSFDRLPAVTCVHRRALLTTLVLSFTRRNSVKGPRGLFAARIIPLPLGILSGSDTIDRWWLRWRGTSSMLDVARSWPSFQQPTMTKRYATKRVLLLVCRPTLTRSFASIPIPNELKRDAGWILERRSNADGSRTAETWRELTLQRAMSLVHNRPVGCNRWTDR